MSLFDSAPLSGEFMLRSTTMGEGVPVQNIAIDHRDTATPAGAVGGRVHAGGVGGGGGRGAGRGNDSKPAYPGAKFDVNGYCIHHSKIRVCRPI